MKAIDQMNLAECLDALRMETLPLDENWSFATFSHQDRIQIADRIQELFECENEGVVAISEAYQRLKEHHRWIPFKERYPVGADGDKILVYNKYNGVFTIKQEQIRDYSPTYWSHITSPEDKP